MPTPAWFNDRKAAQIAAFFARREGDRIAVLKLMKLIYLSDREHMASYGYPILYDRLVSMPHGPVDSITLNLLDGNIQSSNWDQLISDRADHSVSLKREISESDLDELSEAEIASLKTVWEKFGFMDKWTIRDWTHENCPEWEDPHGSANPIPYERVLKFLGHSDASEMASDLDVEIAIEKTFAAVRS